MTAVLALLWQNKRIIADALIVLAIVAALAWVRHHFIMEGFTKGQDSVQAKWDAEKHAQKLALDAAEKRENSIAFDLEAALAKFKAEQKVIDHEVVKYVDRPVYRNKCLDDDGVRAINASAGSISGQAVKPASEVRSAPGTGGADWNGSPPNHAAVGKTVP